LSPGRFVMHFVMQMHRLVEAQKRLDNAVRRSEMIVRSEYVADVLAGLAGIGPEGGRRSASRQSATSSISFLTG
jgi:hypothetical protein